jgi:hypothetical protein
MTHYYTTSSLGGCFFLILPMLSNATLLKLQLDPSRGRLGGLPPSPPRGGEVMVLTRLLISVSLLNVARFSICMCIALCLLLRAAEV